MKSKEVVRILQDIKELINQDVGYEEIINFIDKKKLEVIAEEDIANDYIEDLVNELK